MILPESQFLYRNIRKKQKMIDAFNEIKKEEEENRQHLKLGKVDDKLKNKEQNVVFTKKIQESIERYHPSVSNLLSNTFMSDISNNFNNEINNINNDKNMVTISLSSQMPFNLLDLDKYFSSNKNSFLENDQNINDNTINSQNSIFKIVQILNNSNINENNAKAFNDKNNNIYNKINKNEYKNNISQFNSNKIIKKNDNNIKHNTKKLLVTNNYNSINSSNKNININMNKISNLNNHSIIYCFIFIIIYNYIIYIINNFNGIFTF